MFKFSMPCAEYRALPFPEGTSDRRRSKVGTFFGQVDHIPDELLKWQEVNPRKPKFSKAVAKYPRPVGAVAAGVIHTLRNNPDKFALKNNGIFLLVDHVEEKTLRGGRKKVEIILRDPEKHGVLNGSHTLHCILFARGELEDSERESLGAFVRIHALQNIEDEDVVELAEGLNRSMQVSDATLENAKGSFEIIKQHLNGKQGADQISYAQGDEGAIPIEQIIQMMALFDVTRFSDRRRQPNKIFGQQKAVLNYFVDHPDIFERIIPRLHELLVFSEEIKERLASHPGVSRWKVGKSHKKRSGHKSYQGQPKLFTNGQIKGRIPLGWLYPILAAFRANIDPEAWDREKQLEWRVDNYELLDKTFDDMVAAIGQVRKDNLDKPGEVGRKETAYLLCYQAVLLNLIERGIKVA